MDMLAGGSNAILLLLLGISLAGAALIAFVATRRHNHSLARIVASVAAVAGALYAGGVIAVSAASAEQTLSPGDTKWFCGFYIDCHLGMSVESTETAASIPGSSGDLRAEGVFHIVTLELHNSARNPAIDMTLSQPDAKVVDASGREYPRSATAERALAQSGSTPSPLGAETRVTHELTLTRIVFDLPADAKAPRLMVTEGWILDRAIEFGLIGDENSVFHRKTLLALNGSGAQVSMEQ